MPDRVAMTRDRHLPNVELVSHEGRRVRFYDDLVKGKVVAINFMFATCRKACPAATQNLAEVQDALGDRMGRDVTLLSIPLCFSFGCVQALLDTLSHGAVVVLQEKE